MQRTQQKLIFTLILSVYVLFMIVGALLPDPSLVPLFSGNTPYFHFFGFVVLAFITFKTVEFYECKHNVMLSASILLFLIVLTEVIQLLVSTRQFSLTDMLVDAGGCIVGGAVYSWMYSKR
ncbi:MAG: VanZ family protein [archaeon]